MTVEHAALPPVPDSFRPDTGPTSTAPIPAAAYYDDAWFELERQAVFLNSWIQCGHVCELPETGSFIRREFEFAKASLLIVRGKDGVIRAFHNVCTHRGTQLVEEAQGRKSTFSCPYHMWTFGSDGSLLSAPDFERFHIPKKVCALPQVALDVCAGLIFVNFARQPEQSLRAFLGPIAEKLEGLPVARATTFSEYVYDIDGNWKITYDNFQENYHLRFIHPRTGAMTIGADNQFGYPVHYGFADPHRTQRIWSNPEARPHPIQSLAFGKGVARAAADGLLESPSLRDYFALFPNFFIIGTPSQHFCHTVMPISATKSRGAIRLYWVGEDETASTRFAREFAMATVRDIHSEDIAVIEAGQRGLNSGALDVIHFQEQEVLCRHLYEMVAARVEAWKAKNTGETQA